MESNGAVYAKVPAGGVSALEAAILQARGQRFESGPLGVLAFDPEGHRFALVDRWGKSDNMPRWSEGPDLTKAIELLELSRLVGDVAAFYEVDEGLSLGVYGVWRDGALLRSLAWADDEWFRVEGEPQPWEAPLFGAEALIVAVENAADSGQDEANIRAAFSARSIGEGCSWPTPERLATELRRAYPGPSYGFRPWPLRREVVDSIKAKCC